MNLKKIIFWSRKIFIWLCLFFCAAMLLLAVYTHYNDIVPKDYNTPMEYWTKSIENVLK
jgi:hypothetical protein